MHIVGHREVPGRPAMYGTTKQFLNYFGLNSLDKLPSLAELRDLSAIGKELELDLSDIPGLQLPPSDEDTDSHAEEQTEGVSVTEDIVADAEVTESDNVATIH